MKVVVKGKDDADLTTIYENALLVPSIKTVSLRASDSSLPAVNRALVAQIAKKTGADPDADPLVMVGLFGPVHVVDMVSGHLKLM